MTEAVLENLSDLMASELGVLPKEKVRRISVDDALVDTGATMLSLPTRLNRELGLKKKSTRRVTTSQGVTEANLYSTVRLTIQDRDCPVDVLEVPDDVPVLIGQIPLEYLDFVVDPQTRRLIGNPAHGGQQTYELY
ncbi:MAG: retropepsin-like domain-containing protein [Pirellulales bacterium]|nr:retropepsin-like domain-containing protein [Pirellulales bacterium]